VTPILKRSPVCSFLPLLQFPPFSFRFPGPFQLAINRSPTPFSPSPKLPPPIPSPPPLSRLLPSFELDLSGKHPRNYNPMAPSFLPNRDFFFFFPNLAMSSPFQYVSFNEVSPILYHYAPIPTPPFKTLFPNSAVIPPLPGFFTLAPGLQSFTHVAFPPVLSWPD